MRTKIAVIAIAATCIAALGAPSAHATKDPMWSEQYGPVQIGAPAAWTKATGKGVTVAVVDSGVDVDHPDLRPKIDFANSYDFACQDTNADDDTKAIRNGPVKGHGTHVAGTVGAATDNGVGVAGVAPDARLMGLKVWGHREDKGGCRPDVATDATGDLGAIANAIRWAADRGAKVINLSLSEFQLGEGLVGSTQTPCREAFTKGSLCVVAAGNSGSTKASGYANDFPGLIVTANDSAGRHAEFGQKADTMWGVSAPGVAILNTWPLDDPNHAGYNSIQGTSMAAPHVAGAAAVLFSMGLTNRQVAEALVRTAGPARNSDIEGAGIIRLDKAAGVDTAAAPGAAAAAGGAGPGTVTRGPKATTPVGGSGGGTGGKGSGPAVTLPSDNGFLPEQATDFDEGLSGDGSDESIENILLKTPRKTSANKPFNAVIPIAVISLIALAAGTFVGVPRLRSRDTPSL
ncbi:MAG TPA: S8 family serine peptidase [Acidimicrobiales bacterium]|nr:S8 family serine peptidase [Acidimicrobiales bacterium]